VLCYGDGMNSSHDDQPWDLAKFKKELRVELVSYDEWEMEVDLIGIPTAVANALRRVLLAELPSMAFDSVHMYNNTSVIQDEVLAHRLGLIPLRADPRNFKLRFKPDAPFTEADTLKFTLRVQIPKAANRRADPEAEQELTPVYSREIRWEPLGRQQELYEEADVGPVTDDILIVKLKPGQELDIELWAVKNTGREHAKFQSVATAFYRLMPRITLTEQVTGDRAVRLQESFSPGVIQLVTKNGEQTAVVDDARRDTNSRNVFRHEDLKHAVQISRVPNHFIFSIESVGALPASLLLTEAIEVLIGKCTRLLDNSRNQRYK